MLAGSATFQSYGVAASGTHQSVYCDVAKKPKRDRTVRREAVRRALSLARDKERLFALEPGGAPERPIAVASAPVVDSRARTTLCPRCGGHHHLEEHAAVTIDGVRLREARLKCPTCGSRRSLWFRLPELN